jgi:hypothetical protein
MIDKRRYNRLPVTLPISYKPAESNDGIQEQGGLTQNISQGGIYFLCRTSTSPTITTDQVLHLCIKFLIQDDDYKNIAFTETLKTRGQVLRIETSQERPHICGVALKFLDHLKYIIPNQL